MLRLGVVAGGEVGGGDGQPRPRTPHRLGGGSAWVIGIRGGSAIVRPGE